jgi:UDP-N-acetylmuramyl pentapeptide synthase
MITFNRICETLKGRVLQTSNVNQTIAHVLLDSRKLIFTEQALFIAIKGKHNNSHQFLQDVYDAGVRNFILEENNYSKAQIDALVQANIFTVSNGIQALQNIAKIHRQNFHYPVVGITGSNGKTIVKEWLAHLLKDQLHIVRNPKSYNSQIGVPLSILQMQDVHQMGIFEAGISEPNEMQVLQEIIRPSLGILTMLGDAHDEGFTTKLEKLTEKCLLFQECHSVIYGADQDLVQSYFLGLNQLELKQSSESASDDSAGFLKDASTKKYISWSRQNKQTDYFIETKVLSNTTLLHCNDVGVEIPFTDEASIWNACTCLCFLMVHSKDLASILPRFTDLPALDMRLQLKEAIKIVC